MRQAQRIAVAFFLLVTAAAASAREMTYQAGGDRRVNRLTLRLSGATLQLSDDDSGALLRQAALAETTGVTIRGADGEVDDTLTVDFAGGAFALRDGIRYDGGAGGFDSLVTRNGSFARS